MGLINFSLKSEDEAKKLECPLSRQPNIQVTGTHCTVVANPPSKYAALCSASACCLWEVYGPPENHEGHCGLGAT